MSCCFFGSSGSSCSGFGGCCAAHLSSISVVVASLYRCGGFNTFAVSVAEFYDVSTFLLLLLVGIFGRSNIDVPVFGMSHQKKPEQCFFWFESNFSFVTHQDSSSKLCGGAADVRGVQLRTDANKQDQNYLKLSFNASCR